MPTPALPTSSSGQTPLAVAEVCAAAAGDILRAGYGHAAIAATKGRGNVVTETDFAAEQAVMAILGREYPDHAILSEETAGETRSDSWIWVVDPLDGTKNFSQAIPHFAFNIALCHGPQPVVALTHQPLLRETFTAILGEGCFNNGQQLQVSKRASIAESVLAMDLGYDNGRGQRQLEVALHIWPGMQALRVHGSAALGLAYAAAGRYDLFVHANLQPWDLAAGLLLVREAGGVVTDRDGNGVDIFSETAVAGGLAVHEDFLRLARGLPWRA